MPIQLSSASGRTRVSDRLRYDALYVQDEWTRGAPDAAGRPALRDGAELGARRARTASSRRTSSAGEHSSRAPTACTGYHDITPRMGAAYDLFGNGKTALKVSFEQVPAGRVHRRGVHDQQPGATLVTSINRSLDRSQRRPRRPVRLPEPGGQRRVRRVVEPELGQRRCDHARQPRRARGLGRAEPRLAVRRRRPARAPSAQCRLDVSYNRRWWGNFFVTHNRGARPAGLRQGDADGAEPSAPAGRRRLPGDVPRAQHATGCSARPIRTTRATTDFGDETHYWHGVDLTVNARLRNGLFVQGGTSTGRGVNDTCDVRNRPVRPADGGSSARSSDAGLPLHGAVADEPPRPGHLHRAEDRRAGQRHLPVAAERRSPELPSRPTAAPGRQLPDDGGAVPGGHGAAAAAGTDHRRR